MKSTSSTEDLDRYAGRTLDGKYRLDRLLGRGGMGSVYVAVHLGTERIVAVKLITPRFMRNAQFVERFKREARAAGRLRHPNIVDVTDFGFAQVDDETVAYLVMEYLDGCTLGNVLDEEKRLPVPWVVDVLEQVCSAVDEAHRQGIVHRDLKPDNIWLEPNNLGGFRVKVLDFGIAKMVDAPESSPEGHAERLSETVESFSPASADAETIADAPTQFGEVDDTGAVAAGSEFDESIESEAGSPSPERSRSRELATVGSSELTRAGALLGTPTYMSPEQCGGENLDARSDVYSLGVITYRMLCGSPPFEGDSGFVLRSHRNNEPTPLRERWRKLPKGISRVVMSALDKDPAARPQSAAAFANALRANADDLGAHYRRAFALYSEHFPTILKLSLVAHVPIFIALAISLVARLAGPHWDDAGKAIQEIALGVLQGIATWVTASLISGSIVIMVTQISVAPLRRVRFRDCFALLRRRWRPFVRTGIRVTLRVVFGFVLLFVPGLVMIARYILWAPVVLMEGLEGKAALKRSAVLASRSRRDMFLAALFQLGVPQLMKKWLEMLIGYDVALRGGVSAEIVSQVASLVSIIVMPLVSIVPALLYLKMRQMGGETVSEVVAPIELDGTRRKWESRMKDRLATATTRKNL
ncbi:protein kinase [bacterium]|nr:protein kinase [bacterium]